MHDDKQPDSIDEEDPMDTLLQVAGYFSYLTLISQYDEKQVAQLRKLIGLGHDVNQVDEQGNTPLHIACLKGYYHIAAVLLEHGALVNQLNSHRQTPMIYLFAGGNFDVNTTMLDLLIKYNANVEIADSDGDTVMHYAARLSHPGFMTKVYRKCPPLLEARNNAGRSPLWIAVCRGIGCHYTDRIEELMNLGADISCRVTGKMPLLLEFCTRTYRRDLQEDAIQVLIRGPLKEVMVSTAEGLTALHLASSEPGGHKIVAALIRVGCDCNARSKDGRTPLHFAARGNALKSIVVLLKNGSDPNTADETDKTPLHEACVQGNQEIIWTILAGKADPNRADNDGRRPLHVLAEAGNDNPISVLTESGAEIDAVDKFGMTALHLAVRKGHLAAATTLLLAKANPEVIDINGKCPLDYASSNILDILQTLLNDINMPRSQQIHHKTDYPETNICKCGGLNPDCNFCGGSGTTT
jgi:ankyrin repeat protein